MDHTGRVRSLLLHPVTLVCLYGFFLGAPGRGTIPYAGGARSTEAARARPDVLDATQIQWTTWRDSIGQFQIGYPRRWHLIQARPRRDQRSYRAGEILIAGEVAKVTIREPEGPLWPGEFTVRVLPNPNRLSLDEWFTDFNLSDLWEHQPSDTTLGTYRARTLVRWMYDQTQREYVLVVDDRVYHVFFAEHNSNDPDFPRHQAIYQQILQRFRPDQP
jgi:hypothetical protein